MAARCVGCTSECVRCSYGHALSWHRTTRLGVIVRRLVASLALVSALLLGGCTTMVSDGSGARGSGRMASRDYAETGFSALDIDSAFAVTVTQGDAFKVTVKTDDNLFDYVSVTQSGGTLRIAFDTHDVQSFRSTRQEATITMPSLTAVRLNGASRLNMVGFGPEAAFDANLDGASTLSGEVRATEIKLQSNGSSRTDLAGSGSSLALNADGSSTVELGRLALEQAAVALNGSSRATLAVTGSLDYDLDGNSQLTYSGNPTLGQTRCEGSSRVIRR